MYNPKSLCADEFISDEKILETLAYADKNKDNEELIDSILEKSRAEKNAQKGERDFPGTFAAD